MFMELCVQGMKQPESKWPSSSSFIASKYELPLVHPSQSVAHTAKRLCHVWCKRSAVAAPRATAASPTQGLSSGQPWDMCWDSRSQGSGAAGPCQGKAFVFSVGSCCRHSWCSWAGCVFQQPYPQPKASLQIYAQLILLHR